MTPRTVCEWVKQVHHAGESLEAAPPVQGCTAADTPPVQQGCIAADIPPVLTIPKS